MVVTDIDREVGTSLAPPPEADKVLFEEFPAARFSSASKNSSSLLPTERVEAVLSRCPSEVEAHLAPSSESNEKLTGSRVILWWSTSLGCCGRRRERGGGGKFKGYGLILICELNL